MADADLVATALVGDGQRTRSSSQSRSTIGGRPKRTSDGRAQSRPRVVVENGRLVPMTLPPKKTDWTFDAPHGTADGRAALQRIITIARHLDVRNLHTYLTTTSLNEIRSRHAAACRDRHSGTVRTASRRGN
jgi:hypothetical protein